MKKKTLLFMILLLTGCNTNKTDANNSNSNKTSDITPSITTSSSTNNESNSATSASTIATVSKTSESRFDRKIRIYLNPSVQTRNLYVNNLGTEAEHMNNIARFLYNELLTYQFLDVKVNLRYLSLTDSVKESNTFNSDIHFALHSNAGGGSGSEIFTISSYEFSNTIYNGFMSLGNFKRRGVKDGSKLYEIKNSKAKDKALMEILFHDNVEEAKFIANNEELIAHQFALSMIEYVYTKYSKNS